MQVSPLSRKLINLLIMLYFIRFFSSISLLMHFVSIILTHLNLSDIFKTCDYGNFKNINVIRIILFVCDRSKNDEVIGRTRY